MSKLGSSRNFGYGKQIAYAGYNALRDSYKGGHYSTVDANAERWGEFCKWLKSQHKVADAADIDTRILVDYGNSLAALIEEDEMEVSYGQNLLSSVNVTLAALRHDKHVWVSPSDCVGRKTEIRLLPPAGMCREAVGRAIAELRESGHGAAAIVLELAREFGLRSREGALFRPAEALKSAEDIGKINVIRGTKGGRGKNVDRWISVTAKGMAVLQSAKEFQVNEKNLVPEGWSLFQFQTHVRHAALPVLKTQGLSTIHDLRAAWACEMYQDLTGFPAPCITGTRTATKDLDREARQTLSHRLGHGRMQVVGAYVGTSR